MGISTFSIRHPVATTLLSAALVVGGAFAYTFLPVAALPRAEFPVVNVSALLPGAAPETMATSVAYVAQPQYFGGVRLFFACWCGRRCLRLYVVDERIGCRQCLGLRYRSQLPRRPRRAA